MSLIDFTKNLCSDGVRYFITIDSGFFAKASWFIFIIPFLTSTLLQLSRNTTHNIEVYFMV